MWKRAEKQRKEKKSPIEEDIDGIMAAIFKKNEDEKKGNGK